MALINDTAEGPGELPQPSACEGPVIPAAVLQMLADTQMQDLHDDNGPGCVECPACYARISMRWQYGRRLDRPDEIEHHASCPVAWAQLQLAQKRRMVEAPAPTYKWLALNINHNVRVKLTDCGREIHRQNFAQFLATFPKFPYAYRQPEEDADGWSTWQLWNLMQEFGDHLHMGTSLPFDTTIELDVKST